MTFMTADQAKVLSDVANLNIEVYKPRLAKLIEENAKQGNTAVITVFPKHLPLEERVFISRCSTLKNPSVLF